MNRVDLSRADQRAPVPEIAERLCAQLRALAEHHSPAGPVLLAANLTGRRQVILRYCEALVDRVQAGGR